MKELNGFQIEKWNQYDLPENSNSSTCPKCSHTRKKHKQKCLSLNWDKGLGSCNHCGEVIQLHTYKRKEAQIKPYKRPNPPQTYNLSEKVLKFFEGRKISQRSLKAARISEGIEWMPGINKEVNTIQFNYFVNGELINIKYRDGRKGFKLNFLQNEKQI